MRALAQPGLTRNDMVRWRATWVQPIVDELIDEILDESTGSTDLYLSLCARMPVHTIARAWGIVDADMSRVHELAVLQLSPANDPAGAVAAAGQMADLLRVAIAHRRVEPGDDLISLMCTAELVEEDGERHRLTDDEILAFARLLLTAGAGTTFRGLGSLFVGLLRDREQYELVRDNRALIASTIEESLRWEQPLSAVSRVSRHAPARSTASQFRREASCTRASARRTTIPPRWTDPHRFDVRRAPQPHVTFAGGPHFCLGVHLARMEMETALDAVLDRLPNVRLDPDQPEPHITGLTFRMPTAVPVVWD